MNKYLLTIALISFSTVCVSTTGCTKLEKQKEERKEKRKEEKNEEVSCENGRISKKQPWTIRNGYTLNSFTPTADEVASGRKSAAQKVMEGY